MRRKSTKPYLILFSAVLLLMSIPHQSAESFRGFAMAALTPFLNFFATSQASLKISQHSETIEKEQIQLLKLENGKLRSEVVRLQDLLINERRLTAQVKAFQEASKVELKAASKKHYLQLRNLLKFNLQAVPAQVIYRTPSSWASSLWINVGDEDNKTLGYEAVAKNNPVVVGNSVVGVIDYVGSHQSRVRLITDSGLTPSVRVFRKNQSEFHYLAKGELRGSSKPLWRSRGILLQGVGFNYDFPDDAGPARDLYSGTSIGTDEKDLISLLEVNDLLVTTGMDGVFPPGFEVAKVVHVSPLREGDYYYELWAEPTAGNLDELSTVYVISSAGFDSDDQPPLFGE